MNESVLLISPFFPPNVGGVETHLSDLCQYLDQKNHAVYVITYQPLTGRTRKGGRRFEKIGHIEVRRIQWFGKNLFHKLEDNPFLEFFYLTPPLLLSSFFFMLGRRNRVAVIHAHGFNSAFVAMVLKKIFRKKSVVSTHAIYELSRKPMLARMTKLVLSSSDVILTLSEASKSEIIRIGLQKSKVLRYRHWVDQDLFRPLDKTECKKRNGLAGKFVVGYVGRVTQKKGVHILIQAAKMLSDNKAIHFVFVGPGELVDKVLSAEALGNVTYLGVKEQADLPEIYSSMDIAILPTIVQEGFGRVPIEAMSCGVPVLAPNTGGLAEAISKNAGLFIEPDVNDVVNAILLLYKNPGKLCAISKNCLEYANKYFSKKNAEIIEKSYE